MYIPDYRLEPPDIRPDMQCPECRSDLYVDDVLFDFGGQYLCADCFLKAVLKDEVFDECVSASPMLAIQIAKAIGVDTWTVGEIAEAGEM